MSWYFVFLLYTAHTVHTGMVAMVTHVYLFSACDCRSMGEDVRPQLSTGLQDRNTTQPNSIIALTEEPVVLPVSSLSPLPPSLPPFLSLSTPLTPYLSFVFPPSLPLLLLLQPEQLGHQLDASDQSHYQGEVSDTRTQEKSLNGLAYTVHMYITGLCIETYMYNSEFSS